MAANESFRQARRDGLGGDLSDEERWQLSSQLRYNANRFRLPALPNVWPDWMTAEKRQSMADNFEDYAAHLDGAGRPALGAENQAQRSEEDPQP